MNILYSSSDSYAFLTGISILSLLENNRQCEDIQIYIMDNQITPENREKLTAVVQQFGRKITFCAMPDMEKMTGHKIDTGRWNISTFGRLYMRSVLPDTVHRIINIDCDTIVTGSLEELWNTDMGQAVVGATRECFSAEYSRNVGLPKEGPYLNAGILLVDLDKIAAGEYEKRFTDYIVKYGNALAYLDQDVLNGVVEPENKLVLPIQYNMQSIFYYTDYSKLLQMRHCRLFYTRAELDAAKKDPRIIHFTTCFLDGLRPWIDGNQHPYREAFLEYKRKSPWADTPLWEDKRGSVSRLKSKIIKAVPQWMLAPAVGIVHGILVPKKNKRKMQEALH